MSIDHLVDITGLQCPVPLIKTRRIILKAELGENIQFIGTSKEEISRKEILLAIENLKQEVISNKNKENETIWEIVIKKR